MTEIIDPQIASTAMEEDYENNKSGMLERFIEINTIIPLKENVMHTGGFQGQFALHEIGNSYVNGNYMAVVLLTQAFIEHSLASILLMKGEEIDAESGFFKVIKKSREIDVVNEEEVAGLHELRKIRNSYVHPKFELKNGSLDKRFIDGGYSDPVLMAKDHAVTAIKILKVFMDNSVGFSTWDDGTESA
ncbi:hypothetical protein ACQKC5_12930 [Shewanella baltica]|uniref:hypothetical protein n=1 Tax=Shewanella baltica TaxID=62322 RepID=UPI003D000D22